MRKGTQGLPPSSSPSRPLLQGWGKGTQGFAFPWCCRSGEGGALELSLPFSPPLFLLLSLSLMENEGDGVWDEERKCKEAETERRTLRGIEEVIMNEKGERVNREGRRRRND